MGLFSVPSWPPGFLVFLFLPLTSNPPFPPLPFLMTSRCDSVGPSSQDPILRMLGPCLHKHETKDWGRGWRGGCNPSTTSGDEEKENFEVLRMKLNNSRWGLTGSHSKKGKWFYANRFSGPSGFLRIPFNPVIESPRPVIHGRVHSQK